MDATRNLIDYAMDNNGVEFRNQLYASIHDRVTAAIEAKKQEIAGSLIHQEEKEEGDGHEKSEKKMMKSLDKNKDGKHTMADHKKEEVEYVDELSKSTLGSYVKASAKDAEDAGRDQEHYGHKNDYARGEKRQKGIAKAVDRLTKEEKDDDEEKKEEKPNDFNSKVPSTLGNHFGRKSSSGGKTTETKTGRVHSSGSRY